MPELVAADGVVHCARSLAEALQWMARYRWWRLFPLHVDEKLRNYFLDEVSALGGPEALARWDALTTSDTR